MRNPRRAEPGGIGLPDLLVGLAVLGIVAAAAVPGWSGWRERQLLWRVVWLLEADLQALSAGAARDGRSRGLLLSEADDDLCWTRVRADDGDGVRRTDLQAGRDTVLAQPVCLADLGGGLVPGVPGLEPSTGPSGSRIPEDGIAVPGNLLSVTATASGSSGTLYFSGRRLQAVAVSRYGPTGRLRVWRYRRETGGWEPL